MNNKEFQEFLQSGKKPGEGNAKPHQRKVQREGGLQISCVKWFRMQYPAFSTLLFHPKNEADGAHGKKIAINAAAGVVPGVPDLILALPAEHPARNYYPCYCGLGIELKYGKPITSLSTRRSFSSTGRELATSMPSVARWKTSWMWSTPTWRMQILSPRR